MLYIATVHYGSPRWIEIQARQLSRHIGEPYETWVSLEKVDRSYGRYFDHVVESWGMHGGKLNHLALEIMQSASDRDLLMFLDSDAFPIADPMPLIADGLDRAPLLAVRRVENNNEPQPHPCFCVTTVGFWRELGGDWTAGPTWQGLRGPTSDVGAQLGRRLELTGASWVKVLRSNHTDLDPLHFGVYGDVIYHHGAGSRSRCRMGLLAPVHAQSAPRPLETSNLALRPLARMVNSFRRRAWRRRAEWRIASESARLYDRIMSDDHDWITELM